MEGIEEIRWLGDETESPMGVPFKEIEEFPVNCIRLSLKAIQTTTFLLQRP